MSPGIGRNQNVRLKRRSDQLLCLKHVYICFQVAKDPKFEKLYKNAQFHENPIGEGVFDDIKYGQHALIEWKTTLDLIMKREYNKNKKCEYALGIEEFFTERVAFAFPIGNPWIMEINER